MSLPESAGVVHFVGLDVGVEVEGHEVVTERARDHIGNDRKSRERCRRWGRPGRRW